jgi:hypothetical protein
MIMINLNNLQLSNFHDLKILDFCCIFYNHDNLSFNHCILFEIFMIIENLFFYILMINIFHQFFFMCFNSNTFYHNFIYFFSFIKNLVILHIFFWNLPFKIYQIFQIFNKNLLSLVYDSFLTHILMYRTISCY